MLLPSQSFALLQQGKQDCISSCPSSSGQGQLCGTDYQPLGCHNPNAISSAGKYCEQKGLSLAVQCCKQREEVQSNAFRQWQLSACCFHYSVMMDLWCELQPVNPPL